MPAPRTPEPNKPGALTMIMAILAIPLVILAIYGVLSQMSADSHAACAENYTTISSCQSQP